MAYRYCIGIDPGVKTGFCLWIKDKKQITILRTVSIHEAMDDVRFWNRQRTGEVIVIVEDARLATFGRQGDRYKDQGAGSVKRDCKIWEDFLKWLCVDYRMVRPKKASTKWNADTFKRATGWTGVTSSHARDAAMLVFGM